MRVTPLSAVIFVAQFLGAVLAVPSPLLESAIEDRSLAARAPVIKFHLCKDINLRGDCFYLASEPLTVLGSNSGCVDFKAEVAASIASVRVIDTWQYSVSLYDDVSCNGQGVTVMDSDKDLAEWKNRAKSARIFYLPIDVNTAYPNNAV